jgi:hypothetical protein
MVDEVETAACSSKNAGPEHSAVLLGDTTLRTMSCLQERSFFVSLAFSSSFLNFTFPTDVSLYDITDSRASEKGKKLGLHGYPL